MKNWGKRIRKADIKMFNLYWYDWLDGMLIMPISCSPVGDVLCLLLTDVPFAHERHSFMSFELNNPLYEAIL